MRKRAEIEEKIRTLEEKARLKTVKDEAVNYFMTKSYLAALKWVIE